MTETEERTLDQLLDNDDDSISRKQIEELFVLVEAAASMWTELADVAGPDSEVTHVVRGAISTLKEAFASLLDAYEWRGRALAFYETIARHRSGIHGWPLPPYVPGKIEVYRTVRSDVPMLATERRVLKPGIYDAISNPFGAISVRTDSGILGLKPGEFDVIEWVVNPHLPG